MAFTASVVQRHGALRPLALDEIAARCDSMRARMSGEASIESSARGEHDLQRAPGRARRCARRAPAARSRTRPRARARARCAAPWASRCRSARASTKITHELHHEHQHEDERHARAKCARERPQVEQHADGDEEQAQQHVAERLDVVLDLVAVLGLRDEHARRGRRRARATDPPAPSPRRARGSPAARRARRAPRTSAAPPGGRAGA